MKRYQLLLVLLSFRWITTSDDGDRREKNKVLVITESNYDDIISNTPLILVEFYAPWCEYCQILDPKYEAAAEELSRLDPPIPLAKINGDEEKTLYNRMGVNGYPTIFVYHNGRSFEYEGKRRTDDIVEFMKEEAKTDWKPPEEHVLTLTSDNFTEYVSESDLILVEFYAPWCGHCKRLAPDYARAAKELNLKHKISLSKVDATEETSLAKAFGVDGYPTLKIFRNGKDYEYDGPRDRKGIVEYMVNQSTPATRIFASMKELNLFLSDALEPLVVTLLPDGEEGEMWESYLELANLGRRLPVQFWHCTQISLAKGLMLPQEGGVVITRPLRFQSNIEPQFSVYNGLLSRENLTEVLSEIEKIARPIVGLRYKENEDWWSYPIVVVYLAIDTSKEGREDFIYWRKRLLPIAQNFEGKIKVVMSDEVEYSEEMAELGVKDGGDEIVVALWGGTKEKYIMKEDFDEDSLISFIELYNEGRLHPVLRSQRKPKQKGPTKVVVGSNFEEVVYDATKDVLIEFYAPWCGHCKKLEPKYKELAKKYKKYKDLIIAKFDATANDAPPEFEYKGFPTMFFVPAGELNQIIKYEGGRELDDFSTFLEENAVYALKSKRVVEEL